MVRTYILERSPKLKSETELDNTIITRIIVTAENKNEARINAAQATENIFLGPNPYLDSSMTTVNDFKSKIGNNFIMIEK